MATPSASKNGEKIPCGGIQKNMHVCKRKSGINTAKHPYERRHSTEPRRF